MLALQRTSCGDILRAALYAENFGETAEKRRERIAVLLPDSGNGIYLQILFN